ncbi:MAG: ATP-binding protein [Deltaproteobacteria bacterium]|nr:ATP-binding protein [Deltaproteobacteria bacterium]
MKLRWKFAWMSVGVCAIPMAIAGLSAARIGQSAIRQSIEEQEQTVARQFAEYVADQLDVVLTTLRVEARVLDVTSDGKSLPARETLTKFLQFVYQQRPDFSIIGIYDTRGNALATPAFLQHPRENATLGSHDAISPEAAADLPRRSPLEEAFRNGVAVGPVFAGGEGSAPQVIVAIKYDPVVDQEAAVIVAQISLRRLADYLMRANERAGSATDRRIYLLDRQSRIIASSRSENRSLRSKHLPNVPTAVLPTTPFVGEYRSEEGTVIGAFSPLSSFKMGVLAERPLKAALRPVERMGWATIYWMTISGFVAALVAVSLGRRLSDRVGLLSDGARQVAQGRLDLQLPVQTRDELGALARAFNAMTSSLAAAREEILHQTKEIRVWNESLEKRVEEKTLELKNAQDLLLRSRSLAAIGGLGAGVAHEINNPLSGVLGLSQLLLEDLPDDHPTRPMILDIEGQALRIQQIVSNLLRLSQRSSGEDFAAVDLSRVVGYAIDLCNPLGLAERGIAIVRKIPEPCPPIRGSAVQLEAALIQIIKNAANAMDRNGGTLTFETRIPVEGTLQLAISDTGKGIKSEHLERIFDPFFTTKSHWEETGMGLSVVHKIIEDHGGTIRVESEIGKGTTFFLNFPIDRVEKTLI